MQDKLYLGNLDAKRDWGYAPEYVEAMWLMLQQDEPDDYVIATGETHTVREFVELGVRPRGPRLGAVRRDRPELLPPAEVESLCGDPSKAREQAGVEGANDLRRARAP